MPKGARMGGSGGSSPWRRLAWAAGCVIVLFVVAGSLRASDSRPQPTAVRAQTRQAIPQLDHARQVAQVQQQSAAAATPAASPQRALVNRYCVGCHNEKLKTGGLVLATIDVDSASADNAEVLEKVVRKLQARAMPPRGMPRPDETAYSGFVSHLETSLGRLAAGNPNPGRPDTLRRLNRTEYQNAIRDLLDLEADVAAILPSDDSAHGFDNVSLGGLSPTLLERYLGASQKISRLAVGTPVRAPGEETVVLPTDLTQEDYFDGQPFGTRAGGVVRHVFPADGEYVFKLQLTRDRDYRIEGLTEPHQIEVSIDGERLQLFALNPIRRVRVEFGGVDESAAAAQADAGLVVRAAVKAGPHEVRGVFLKKSSALSETARQPYQARFNKDRHPRRQPALHSVSITGPYNATGISETPSRRRIFACRPARPADEPACARTIITTLARRAYRRPATNDDVQTLLTFYQQGRADGGFDYGVEMALRAMLVSPQFLFRVEEDPANIAPNTPYRLSDLELASRLSFFLWSSIPDDELLDVAARGKLSDQATLERQVRRMLADRRSEALVTNFGSQWLYLRNLSTHIPDPRLLPDFDDNLRQAMRRETELFFQSIIDEDRSVVDLLRANYTFLNERLAKHYGIPNVYGGRFRRVIFEEGSPRGGLLGQGSILTVTLVRQPDLARAPGQVGAGKHYRHDCAPAAAGCAAAQGRRCRGGEGAHDAGAHGPAPQQPGVRRLPPGHGSGRPGGRELRRHRPVARPRRRGHEDGRVRRSSGRQHIRRCGRPAGRCGEAAGSFCLDADRQADDLCAGSRDRILRWTRHSSDHEAGGRERIPFFIDHSGHRQ